MLRDKDAAILVRIKKRSWTFFVHDFTWFHWYYEGYNNYRLVELQLMWFLVTYEKDE